METSASGDNAIAVAFGADQKRLADALLPDGGQDIGDIRVFAAMPHIELADMELLDGDGFQCGLCHGIVLLCWRVKRKAKRPCRASPVDGGKGEAFCVS